MKVERLTVVVQTKGPMETRGSFDVFGRTAMLEGSDCPREVSTAVSDVIIGPF
jgi:hypothetical protein